MIGALSMAGTQPGQPRGEVTTTRGLRRIKRLALFALAACVTLAGDAVAPREFVQQLTLLLALGVILVACWAMLAQVAGCLQVSEARRVAEAERARLEGARVMASAGQDRVANKLSLTAGYCEFLMADPSLPADVREQAERAREGALAAAAIVSHLKRSTWELR